MGINNLSINIIPIFVYILNYVILGINIFSFVKVLIELKKYKDSVFLALNMAIVVGCILVNTFSQINHYIVYFQADSIIPNTATLMRFADRYSMFFVAILTNLKCQEFVMNSMGKYFLKVR